MLAYLAALAVILVINRAPLVIRFLFLKKKHKL
jgi:hypothetical protein